MKKKLSILWGYMKGNRTLYLLSVAAIVLAAFFQFLSPLVMRITIDSVIGDMQVADGSTGERFLSALGGRDSLQANLWRLATILVMLTVSQGVFHFVKGKWLAQASEATAKNLREKLYNHIQRLPFSYHVKVETGDLIQRCSSDVETVRRFLAVQFVEVGRALFMLAMVLPIMISLDWRMTLASMSVIPVIFTFAIIFFMKVEKNFKLADEAEGAMSAMLQENLSGIRVVKAFYRQEFEIEKFHSKNSDNRDKWYRFIRLMGFYWGGSDTLCFFQILVIMVLGSYRAVQGEITIGTLVAFVSYVHSLLWPIRQMGRILTDMGKTFVSVTRIQEVLDEPEEPLENTGIKPAHIEGKIEFEHVDFSYDGKNPVLQDVSFTIEAGKTVAILGPTGSGKTSMVNLLPRLYDVTGGTIRLDGHDIREIDREYLRQNIAIVLQEPFLFSRTLEENIRLGTPEATRDHVAQATEVASIHDVIERFENGYETVVGEKGVTLSGGQKQRVAIARSIIMDAPVLVFDDSLSAVDTETDSRIRAALKESKQSVTTFIIAHRITTLVEADMILVLDEGRIVQQGTHRELVGQEGLYRRIWNIQNALEKDVHHELDDEVDLLSERSGMEEEEKPQPA